jgi:hypothetical protein
MFLLRGRRETGQLENGVGRGAERVIPSTVLVVASLVIYFLLTRHY